MKADIFSTFMNYLNREGLARTPQRKAVLEEIVGGPSHFDVEELVKIIQCKSASVSRATVYRTITHLENAGIIRKIDFNHSHAHFELVKGASHHEHLICEKCGKVEEFVDSELELRIGDIARTNRFKIKRHTIQIFGLCECCSESSKP